MRLLNYRKGINKGLFKIMSKMGISTIASYRCSNLFEAVGLRLRYHGSFASLSITSRIQGAGFDDIHQDLMQCR